MTHTHLVYVIYLFSHTLSFCHFDQISWDLISRKHCLFKYPLAHSRTLLHYCSTCTWTCDLHYQLCVVSHTVQLHSVQISFSQQELQSLHPVQPTLDVVRQPINPQQTQEVKLGLMVNCLLVKATNISQLHCTVMCRSFIGTEMSNEGEREASKTQLAALCLL